MAATIFGNNAKKAILEYQSDIVKVAKLYNLDGRAIAGVIWWEHDYNPRGWISDFFQYPWVRAWL